MSWGDGQCRLVRHHRENEGLHRSTVAGILHWVQIFLGSLRVLPFEILMKYDMGV